MTEISYINGMLIWDADYCMTDEEYYAWMRYFHHRIRWEPQRSTPLPNPIWFDEVMKKVKVEKVGDK